MEKDKTLMYVILGAMGVFLIAIIVGFVFIGKAIKGVSKPDKNSFQMGTAEMGPTFELGDITVNLGSGENFLKTTIVLELYKNPEKKDDVKANDELKKDIEQKAPKLKDKVISILSQQTIGQLKESSAQEKIKSRLLEEVQRIAGKNRVRQLYFTNFIYE